MNVNWRRLFESYAAAAIGGDAEATAAFYAPSFIAAGPKGSAAFQNDERFLAWLRRLKAFNDQAGMQSLSAASIDAHPLGEHFAVVTVEWGATFRKTGDQPIRFKITYIVDDTTGSPRIVLYASHEDQEETMRSHGLLPDAAAGVTE